MRRPGRAWPVPAGPRGQNDWESRFLGNKYILSDGCIGQIGHLALQNYKKRRDHMSMSSRTAEPREGSSSRGRLSRTAVLLAACGSCLVVVASAFGFLGAPVVVGALGVAAVIAVISFRHSVPQAPAHVFSPLTESEHDLVVAAPRAADLVSAPISTTDVA